MSNFGGKFNDLGGDFFFFFGKKLVGDLTTGISGKTS